MHPIGATRTRVFPELPSMSKSGLGRLYHIAAALQDLGDGEKKSLPLNGIPGHEFSPRPMTAVDTA